MFYCIFIDNLGKMMCSYYQQCLNGKELFFAFAGDQKGKLLPESLQRLCPGLLYQLTDMTTDCIMVSVPGPEEHGMDISTEVVNHSAGEYCTFRDYPFPKNQILKEKCYSVTNYNLACWRQLQFCKSQTLDVNFAHEDHENNPKKKEIRCSGNAVDSYL